MVHIIGVAEAGDVAAEAGTAHRRYPGRSALTFAANLIVFLPALD